MGVVEHESVTQVLIHVSTHQCSILGTSVFCLCNPRPKVNGPARLFGADVSERFLKLFIRGDEPKPRCDAERWVPGICEDSRGGTVIFFRLGCWCHVTRCGPLFFGRILNNWCYSPQFTPLHNVRNRVIQHSVITRCHESERQFWNYLSASAKQEGERRGGMGVHPIVLQVNLHAVESRSSSPMMSDADYASTFGSNAHFLPNLSPTD